MVKIEETAEEEEGGSDPIHFTSTSSPPLSPLPSSSFNFPRTNYNPQQQQSHPPLPQPTRPLSPPGDSLLSSPSSISSDHTFHGFSPHHDSLAHPSPSPIHTPSPPPEQSPFPPQPAVVNRLIREDPPPVVTKTESQPLTGVAGENGAAPAGGSGGEQGVGKGRAWGSLSILDGVRRQKIMRRVALGLRVFEFVVCLISFSVMAADRNQGWALDSFYGYKEFRYCISVNVIGFAYSGIQVVSMLHQLVGKEKTDGSLMWCYFDFSADQILAYLLVSASSSAATRVDDWILNWGKDKFPTMASASVGMSFAAFVAFGLSSLISGYLLCRVHRVT